MQTDNKARNPKAENFARTCLDSCQLLKSSDPIIFSTGASAILVIVHNSLAQNRKKAKILEDSIYRCNGDI